MGKTPSLRDLLLTGCLLCFQACAQAATLTGVPSFTRFTPDLDVYPQNFAIAEDRNSIIYVGNSDGVLTFDGAHWTLVALPNHQLVRSLAYDGHDRVYVGGYNLFGYIQRDDAGQPVYHDLTSKFTALLHGEQFSDIWSISITPVGVLFQAVQHLFLYDPASGKTRLWRYPARFGAVGMYHGKVVAQFRGVGLKYLDYDSWRMMPDGKALTKQAYQFISMPDGGLLMLSTDGRWLEYVNDRVRNFPVPKDFPLSSYFSNGIVLSDDTLTLTSVDGTVYFLSLRSHVLRSIHLDNGYLNGVVAENSDGILVIADQAVIHVDWPAAWTRLGADQELFGILHRAVHWGAHWYVMSGSGVYESDMPVAAGGTTHFRRLDWSNHEGWDLLPLDKDTALLANSYALAEIHSGRAKTITHAHLYPRVLLRSRYDKNLVYIGTEEDLATLVNKEGRWRLRLDQEGMNALGVNSMVEVAPHTIWVGSERGGVRLLKLSDDNARIISDRRMGVAEALDYGDQAEKANVFQMPNGDILVSTRVGEFRWQGGKFVRDDLGGLDKLRVAGRQLVFAESSDGLWAFDYSHVYHRDVHSGAWHEAPVNRIRRGAAFQSLSTDADGGVMLVTSQAILCYRPGIAVRPAATANTMLRSVLLTRADGTRRYLPLGSNVPLQLLQGEFSLTFSFALPEYSAQDAIRYKARLKGFEAEFSDWSSSHQYTYSHLRPIAYRFQVRGKDEQGHITDAVPFSFVVVPKWYASEWARIVWIALLALAGIVLAVNMVRLRTRRLAADKSRLEAMVAERTAELEAANRQLETMAHLDGLTGIPNRRRLDDYLDQVWAQSIERQRKLSLLVIDVDHFKSYNDRHGHLAGDRLLKKLVGILSNCLRRTEDLLARYGGEEFLVVLPGADEHAAYELAEQMRAQVETTSLGATISVGVATGKPGPGMSVANLVNEADTALYQAKAAGRNRTVALHG